MNGVENKRILELEEENKRLSAKNKELEEKLEKANSTVMAYTNELQTREVIKAFGRHNGCLIFMGQADMGVKDELNRFFIGEKEIDTSGIPEFPGDLINYSLQSVGKEFEFRMKRSEEA